MAAIGYLLRLIIKRVYRKKIVKISQEPNYNGLQIILYLIVLKFQNVQICRMYENDCTIL